MHLPRLSQRQSEPNHPTANETLQIIKRMHVVSGPRALPIASPFLPDVVQLAELQILSVCRGATSASL
jgi:hypothetical protein